MLKIKEKEKHWLQTCMSVWENAKIDARKETAIKFAQKVKTKIKELRRKYHEDYINGLGDEEYNGITESDIDELLKEMGVDNG